MTKKTRPPLRATTAKAPYLNTALPIAKRVADLVSRMTLKEKVSQMIHEAPAIERLGIPDYNWWNECLHGVGRAGLATVFPQSMGMAATFNRPLVRRVADATSDEARAKYHHAQKSGNHGIYFGLTYWTPNINIFRDPRWGRGQETYGEDPYLTGEMGLQFVKGLQGDDPRYLKLVATPKHYAAHSGPEHLRHGFDAIVSNKDMEETYLPHFRKTVVEGKAHSVMGAYNRTNGEACCGSKTLLQRILRDTWKFDGYVVSDCGAIDDFHNHHKLTRTAAESAALAVKNGCELNCGATYPALIEAHQKGLITEAEIDLAVTRLFAARMRLGMFDPQRLVPYSSIPYEVVNCDKHRALAVQAARESIVLLKNEKRILPLDLKKYTSVLVTGPTANECACLIGNYCGSPNRPVTPLAGIVAALPPSVKVVHDPGCGIDSTYADMWDPVVRTAKNYDLIIACMGLSALYEGEEGCTPHGGDRGDIALMETQEKLLAELFKTGKPVIVVLLNGSALAVNSAAQHAAAIIEAWYPGESGGTAIADVITGKYNPAGRLPVTCYKSLDQLPPFEDYRMTNRTYRFFEGEPLYPFGYGLSYTTFAYSKLQVATKAPTTAGGARIAVSVKNTGATKGDEVVQVYVRPVKPPVRVPLYQLCEFRRVPIAKGAAASVAFDLPAGAFSVVLDSGKRVVLPGEYDIFVGGCLPSTKGAKCLRVRVKLTGETVEIPGAF